MAKRVGSIIDGLRKPEHTGENRCLPCTAVNVAIAIVLAGAVGLLAVELAPVVFAASLGLVYLRGYLVPGTPRLTRRFLPDRVLASFGKRSGAGEDYEWETIEKLERERERAVDPEAFLRDVEAIEPRGDDEEFELAPGFARDVDETAAPLRERSVGPGDLADLFACEVGDVTDLDRDYPAVRIDHRIRKWPSPAAQLADVAFHRTLARRTDRWAEVPLEQRLQICRFLRSLVETCPRCGGDTSFREDAVESCCGAHEVTRVACAGCGDRLVEFGESETTGSGLIR